MIITVYPEGMSGPPVKLRASLVVAMLDGGEPVLVAGEYGPDGMVMGSTRDAPDFSEVVQKLGLSQLKALIEKKSLIRL